MICEQTVKKFCKDFTKIENYEKAISDTAQTWQCHHQLETHNSDGTERPRNAQLSREELIALDMYYNRPAEELIFLTEVEHKRLHNVGKKRRSFSEEWKKKLSEAHKGKHHSEEHKKKLYEANKGKHSEISEETRRKLSEANKGKHWKLVDGKRVWY